ncbi:membrane lipoprotein lipid attachment site-containing protein [Rodentibacter caecimuris]|uniref:membrane lipoprotein lipid attachment site-containing protein n=1 Tax=Rodentibacter caecimuris TaxID=1796644 RepID=UPI0022491AD6|nr:membrane lipoprotein lipid attachment site-containing protein [Rodentibacter heylii]MCX2960883.1 membrane lipoprotein lipid attachment site-containing protein [Rodentibacter heylii]
MKKTLLCLGIVAVLSGCARDTNQPFETWNNFEQSKISTQLAEKQSLRFMETND